jgi:hypothetical protein
MTSGGARARSGPAPDPNALRRDRKDDKDWVALPAEGFTGDVPEFPLSDAYASETVLWAKLWAKPQAYMWSRLGLEYQVAAYVRAFLESVQEKASAGLKTAVLRMEAELGLSTVGMGQLRWKIAADELAERREVAAPGRSARDRLQALDG